MRQWRRKLVPVHVMRKDNPLEMAHYAFDNRFTNICGWKWTEKHKRYTKQFSKLLARIYTIKTTPIPTMGKRNKFKFGFQVQI